MTRVLGIAAVIACAIAVVRVATGGDEPRRSRPASAPVAGAGARHVRPQAPPEPVMPAVSAAWKAELADRVRGVDRPGEAAFRAVSDRYVDENLALAERRAADEQLTLAEIRELTYFGLLVLATQRTDDVEEITGRALTAAERAELGEVMGQANRGFQDAMRALVARRATEAERWALIRDTEARYRSELDRITGLDAARLDDLLAGNIALPGAPARGDVPQGPPAPRDDGAVISARARRP